MSTRPHVPVRLLLLSLVATLACSGPGVGKTAYVGMELWDGTGAPVVHDAVIIVTAEGRIEDAGPPDLVKVPRGAREVRLDGRWVIPGLIDAHAHVRRATAGAFLGAGVTTVRDMGGAQDSVVALRNAIDYGEVEGPRLYIAGAPVDGAPATWPYATTVRGSGDARRAVGDRVLIDASHVVVGPRLPARLLEVLLDEARALETPVIAVLGSVNAESAVRMGVRGINLLTGLPGWRAPDSVAAERLATMLAAADVTMVPALVRRTSRAGARSAEDLFLRRFRAAGGRLGAGTDAGFAGVVPGSSMHDEIAHLVAAGFSNEDALLAATRDGARVLGVDSLGTLVAGALADFIVLGANPLDDVANVSRLERIYVSGVPYEPAPAGSTP